MCGVLVEGAGLGWPLRGELLFPVELLTLGGVVVAALCLEVGERLKRHALRTFVHRKQVPLHLQVGRREPVLLTDLEAARHEIGISLRFRDFTPDLIGGDAEHRCRHWQKQRAEAARNSGREIVRMVNEDLTPAKILSPASFRNAIRVLHSVGGSTNAILHLLALSGRVGGELTPEQINSLGENIPVLADVEPSGEFLIQDFHNAGGLPQLLTALEDHIEGDALNQSGKSWKSQLTKEFIASPVIRALNNPLKEGGAFTLVKGNLAPDGALLKTSAASPHLLVHKGPAVVFNGYEEMRKKLDDPDLEIAPDSILVLRGCGAVGVPGAPEWGMMQIPKKLALQGITDMVRITDARMSGTSFGTCLLHVSPEAAVGGPLALVENGDLISLDVPAGRLDLLISPDEVEKRRANWIPPKSEHLRGWPALYQKHVLQPDLGCDFDFLRAPTPEHRRFVPPIVGRS